jgi:putative ABC transport system permease protein
MIRFLLKGLIRDKNRSLFPVITVALGVMLTVLMYTWITGVMGDTIDFNAKFSTGHVKIMTRAYVDNIDQRPNDLAILEVSKLMEEVKADYPEMTWAQRITFGGLLDVPDENGETRSQGTTMGLGIDLLSSDSKELDRIKIRESIVAGHLPSKNGEILISNEFAEKLEVDVGQQVTLISSTMYGGMAMYNFTIAGMVEFGMAAFDRGAIVADLSDVQLCLDMVDACSEVLGFYPTTEYIDEEAKWLAADFNSKYETTTDQFAPHMLTLTDQNDLGTMLQYVEAMKAIVVFVFVLAMSIVLWNAGLLGGIRRYGEIGLRLAIGENKGRVYRSMISESVLIGVIGSALGTIIGLGFAYYLQEVGFDFSQYAQKSTLIMPNVYRAQITPVALVIGFFPGVFSTVLGTMLSGVGIFKRKTAQLFKELEV